MKIERLQMEGPRDDEVLVRLVASGICHTDIGFWQSGESDPVVLGHEGAGVVERVGARVAAVRRGDHVVLSYQSCGRCRNCRAGNPAHCTYFWKLNFGFARLDGSNALAANGVRGHFFGQSSFATYALATERNLVKVSKRLPLALLSPLGCALQTGAGTVLHSLAVQPGSTIAILGAGSVGLAAVMAARVAGAGPIIAVDLRANRLRLALELGATHVIHSRRTDPAAKIAAICPAIDHAVDTTGDASLELAVVRLLRPGGRMASLAGGNALDGSPEGRRVLSVIQGDSVPQLFIPRLIRLWQQGRFPFDRLVTFYDFAQINRAIADSRRGTTIKPVLRISEP